MKKSARKEEKRSRVLAINGGRCIYTNLPATSADHVPPKCLLLHPLPTNLATVPCDRDFNSSIALDEQYFLVFIGSIVTHAGIARRVDQEGDIYRALSASPGLDQRLINQLVVTEDGRVAILPEEERIARVIRKIAAGAYFLRFGQAPGLNSFTFLTLSNLNEPTPEAISISWTSKPIEDMHVIQWSVFSYGFAEDSEHGLVCNLNFYDSIFGFVKCPPLT